MTDTGPHVPVHSLKGQDRSAQRGREGLTEEGPKYMRMWCVTFDTKDYPGRYVARLFHNDQPQETCVISENLETIHELMYNLQLAMMDPWPNDDPVIKEIWL